MSNRRSWLVHESFTSLFYVSLFPNLFSIDNKLSSTTKTLHLKHTTVREGGEISPLQKILVNVPSTIFTWSKPGVEYLVAHHLARWWVALSQGLGTYLKDKAINYESHAPNLLHVSAFFFFDIGLHISFYVL